MVRVRITQPSLRRDCRQRTVKEDPDVTSLPGAGTLQGGGHTEHVTGLQKREGVVLPGFFVEIRCEEPACFVRQERIYSYRFLAQEMAFDDNVGQWEELPRLLMDLLPVFGA